MAGTDIDTLNATDGTAQWIYDGIADFLPYNCSRLPTSMNGGQFPRGCPGAVYSDGSPSREYCEGGELYPWWGACCSWREGTCVPRTGDY